LNDLSPVLFVCPDSLAPRRALPSGSGGDAYLAAPGQSRPDCFFVAAACCCYCCCYCCYCCWYRWGWQLLVSIVVVAVIVVIVVIVVFVVGIVGVGSCW
jgi:hypothetical protein